MVPGVRRWLYSQARQLRKRHEILIKAANYFLFQTSSNASLIEDKESNLITDKLKITRAFTILEMMLLKVTQRNQLTE